MNEILLSIVIPCFNGEKYIAAMCACIRQIPDEDYEVIFVNDGSTDGSRELLEAVISDRIKVFHIQNRGVSGARNYGLKKATGKYIMFADIDDIISSLTVTYLKKTLKNNKEPDICLYRRVLYQNIAELDIQMYDKEKYYFEKVWDESNKVDLMRNLLRQDEKYEVDFGGHIWGRPYKKSFLLENKLLFNETMSICEDSEFSLRTMALAKKVVYSHAINYFYCTGNADSAIHKWYQNLLPTRKIIEEEKEIYFKPYFSQLGALLRISHINGFMSLYVYDFANRNNTDGILKTRMKLVEAYHYSYFFRAFKDTKWSALFKMERPSKEKFLLIMTKMRLFMVLAFICKLARKR